MKNGHADVYFIINKPMFWKFLSLDHSDVEIPALAPVKIDALCGKTLRGAGNWHVALSYLIICSLICYMLFLFLLLDF